MDLEEIDPARSALMSKVRRSNTTPEILVRRQLHRQGLRFRLHAKWLPGSPDIVMARWRTVIFVHGCFWHRHAGCRYASTPKTRVDFWNTKFARNVQRDAKVESDLRQLGWRVIVIWECETKSTEKLVQILTEHFPSNPDLAAIPRDLQSP